MNCGIDFINCALEESVDFFEELADVSVGEEMELADVQVEIEVPQGNRPRVMLDKFQTFFRNFSVIVLLLEEVAQIG